MWTQAQGLRLQPADCAFIKLGPGFHSREHLGIFALSASVYPVITDSSFCKSPETVSHRKKQSERQEMCLLATFRRPAIVLLSSPFSDSPTGASSFPEAQVSAVPFRKHCREPPAWASAKLGSQKQLVNPSRRAGPFALQATDSETSSHIATPSS